MWIGGGVIAGAGWCHKLRGRQTSFHPECYSKEIGDFLTKEINKGIHNSYL